MHKTRIKLLYLSVILLLISILTTNAVFLIFSLLFFVETAFYNMAKICSKNKTFTIQSLGRKRRLLLLITYVGGVFGITMALFSLLLQI